MRRASLRSGTSSASRSPSSRPVATEKSSRLRSDRTWATVAARLSTPTGANDVGDTDVARKPCKVRTALRSPPTIWSAVKPWATENASRSPAVA